MKTIRVLLIALVFVMLLAACSAETQPQFIEVTRIVTDTGTVEVEVTKVVEKPVEVTRQVEVQVEVPVTPEPEPVDRHGGWLDTIVVVREPNQEAAIARIAAGDIQAFADDVAGEAIVQAIEEAGNIETRTQYGLFDEIFFNGGVCSDQALLNPFQNAKIREAMNFAVDRDYIADELYAGLALPKIAPHVEAGLVRGQIAPEIRSLESQYAYDLEKAREIITAEMEGMGATLEDGLWTYQGQPINLIGLIRNEDTRLEIGNYYANQLEELGFLVERVERTSGELAPIWISGNPVDCEWNWYTGAWSQSEVDREDTLAFEQYYTDRVLPWENMAVYETPERLDEISLRLFNNDYADLDERLDLIREGLPLALEMSPRIWLTSRLSLVPFSDDVELTTDLAAGLSGAAIWPWTTRLKDQVGGSMTIALPDIWVEPYNPVGGSNWVMDSMIKNGVVDQAFYSDPNTGLYWPSRAERGEVVVQEGFPMQATLDWVDLSFEPEVIVPDDAWAAWDAENQLFLTAGEVYTEPQHAVFKSTVYYPADMFETIKWHDGTPLSVADFLMAIITQFDLGDENSPYYDENLVPDREQFLSAFKGLRIASTDPLVIEHWGDNPSIDAERAIYNWWPGDESTAAGYDFGDAAWHNMAIMLRGEENGSFAFTADKADVNEIEQTSMIGGPSLQIMATELAAAKEEQYIPYEATLGQYLTPEEAEQAYSNLEEFARRYGHYYLGTGPYFLQGVFTVEGQAILANNPDHPDAANRWDRFGPPAVAEVEIDGPGRVTIGQEATFDVYVDALGEPYAVEDVNNVTYLLFDAAGNLVEQGDAAADSDGLWVVTLSANTTGALPEGSNRLDIVVNSKIVALASLTEFPFVTAP
ncbi:MAG: ABC transporter substrate-binding protein [Candidatus Promineifilaceae bacterium]